MQLAIGSRLYSATCSAEVIVVKAPAGEVELTCGGEPLQSAPSGAAAAADAASGSQLGKRYADDALGLELLVTKGGAGALAANGKQLAMKDPRRLPSSD